MKQIGWLYLVKLMRLHSKFLAKRSHRQKMTFKVAELNWRRGISSLKNLWRKKSKKNSPSSLDYQMKTLRFRLERPSIFKLKTEPASTQLVRPFQSLYSWILHTVQTTKSFPSKV